MEKSNKVLTVVVPTYNEEKNIQNLYNRLMTIFKMDLSNYTCRILFIDNCSTDMTRSLISGLCKNDKNVQAIFNAKNFGFSRSQFYGLSQANGDAAFLLNADMQDPPELIPKFVKEWENGYEIVAGIKSKSAENPIMYIGRNFFYKIIRYISEIDHIDQFDGFGLYDKKFIRVLRNMDDSLPYLRGIVAELGANRKNIEYKQNKREHGVSHFRFMALYDLAMLGITSYTKVIMHICTLIGSVAAIISIIVGAYTFVMKLLHWDSYPLGMAATQVGIFILGALVLFFIGLLGEYIVNMNIRLMHHPIVVEEKRINFE